MINPNETLNQLANTPTDTNRGLARLTSMIGAKNFVHSEADNYISFKFMRGAANKANYIKITLTAADLYNVEFGKIHGMDYKVISEYEGLYADMLFNLFQEETKLALSL